MKGGHRGWHLTTALAALASYEARTGRGSGLCAQGEVLDEIERTGVELDRHMKRLRREPDLDRRRELVRQFGPLVGKLDRLLEQSTAAQGPK
jgi:hypothetical protein